MNNANRSFTTACLCHRHPVLLLKLWFFLLGPSNWWLTFCGCRVRRESASNESNLDKIFLRYSQLHHSNNLFATQVFGAALLCPRLVSKEFLAHLIWHECGRPLTLSAEVMRAINVTSNSSRLCFGIQPRDSFGG